MQKRLQKTLYTRFLAKNIYFVQNVIRDRPIQTLQLVRVVPARVNVELLCLFSNTIGAIQVKIYNNK